MMARILVWGKAALIVGLACVALGVGAAGLGSVVSRFRETELLARRDFTKWPKTLEEGRTTWSETVTTPFDGRRANWRIVGTLHVNVPGEKIAFSMEGQSFGEWTPLDRREISARAGDTKVALEPRPFSPLTLPPDQVRVTIEMLGNFSGDSRVSLRAGRAGIFNSRNPPTWAELAGLALLIGVAGAGAAFTFSRRWRAASLLRTATINVALMVVSGAVTLVTLEVATRLFLVFPDCMATTRVSELWWARHWNPINEAGYRDVSHTPESIRGKKILFIVGDSFAAGHGIARFEDTFSQLLASNLGDAWAVVVLAKPGMSTRNELAALAACPWKPDAIVVAHVWNDVNSALVAQGIAIPGKPTMSLALKPIVSRSYFLDFVYWRVRGLGAPMASYLDLILSAYEDGAIWDTHAQDLAGFADYAKRNAAPLLVVAFPALENIEVSRITSARPAAFFRAQGIPTIDFAETFAGQDPRAITVNRFDSHPNEATHARVAEEIGKELAKMFGGESAAPARP